VSDTDPLRDANPADMAEQARFVDDAVDDGDIDSEPGLEVDPADFVEQWQTVPDPEEQERR
jgi:hypothetical protein